MVLKNSIGQIQTENINRDNILHLYVKNELFDASDIREVRMNSPGQFERMVFQRNKEGLTPGELSLKSGYTDKYLLIESLVKEINPEHGANIKEIMQSDLCKEALNLTRKEESQNLWAND